MTHDPWSNLTPSDRGPSPQRIGYSMPPIPYGPPRSHHRHDTICHSCGLPITDTHLRYCEQDGITCADYHLRCPDHLIPVPTFTVRVQPGPFRLARLITKLARLLPLTPTASRQ